MGLSLARAAEPIVFAPHEAAYEFRLHGTPKDPNVKDVVGKMAYRLSGDDCVGFTQEMMFLTETTTRDGKTSRMDLRSKGWEDAAASTFRFQSSTANGAQTATSIEGTARRTGTSVTIRLTSPEQKTVTLSGPVMFPVEHSRHIIEQARTGKSTFEADLLDGSEDGVTVYTTVTKIGQPITGLTDGRPEAAENYGTLNDTVRWPVTVDYYVRTASTPKGPPVYTLSFEFYDKAVSRAVIIDYGDVAIEGTTRKIRMSDDKPCK